MAKRLKSPNMKKSNHIMKNTYKRARRTRFFNIVDVLQIFRYCTALQDANRRYCLTSHIRLLRCRYLKMLPGNFLPLFLSDLQFRLHEWNFLCLLRKVFLSQQYIIIKCIVTIASLLTYADPQLKLQFFLKCDLHAVNVGVLLALSFNFFLFF